MSKSIFDILLFNLSTLTQESKCGRRYKKTNKRTKIKPCQEVVEQMKVYFSRKEIDLLCFPKTLNHKMSQRKTNQFSSFFQH